MTKINDLNYGVSLVIPTLESIFLKWTIEKLNQCSIISKEILICISEEDVNILEEF